MCPFTTKRRPPSRFRDKQIYHCFGCGKGAG
ncbi:MAG: CHC2 zinc finger domain-containing protein [Flavonifractor plautii]